MQIVDDRFLYLMIWLLIHLFSTRCSDAYSDTMLGYANSIRTIDGGTHIDGTKAALTRTLNSLGKKSKSIKVHFFFHFSRGFSNHTNKLWLLLFFSWDFRVGEVFD